jgi:hypothetical protein
MLERLRFSSVASSQLGRIEARSAAELLLRRFSPQAAAKVRSKKAAERKKRKKHEGTQTGRPCDCLYLVIRVAQIKAAIVSRGHGGEDYTLPLFKRLNNP